MRLIEKKDLVEGYLKRTPSHLSSFSFVSIFLWKNYFEFEFIELYGSLCVYAIYQAGTFLYLPPLGGQVHKRTIDACFTLMHERNNGSNVSRIENMRPGDIDTCPAEDYLIYKKDEEYCYFRKDIAGLKGNGYKSQRCAYNNFVKNNKHSFIAYEPSMQEECLNLYCTWRRNREGMSDDTVYTQMLNENYDIHRNAMRYYKQLGLTGRVVLVDDKIKAYTFGYPLSGKIFCVLMEITDPAYTGLPAFIFREFCADKELEGFDFINAMDCFGIKNVERAKMSYRPVALLASYTLIKTGTDPVFGENYNKQ